VGQRKNSTAHDAFFFVAHMAVLLPSVKGKRPKCGDVCGNTLLECMAKTT